MRDAAMAQVRKLAAGGVALLVSVLIASCGSPDAGSGSGGQDASTIETCVGTVCLDTVNVTDAGNPADADTGMGSVAYEYAIGAHEVTVGQYTAFLNAVAQVPAESAIGELWVEEMEKPYPYVSPGLIKRTGTGTTEDPYVYTEIPDPALGDDSPRRAILNISWFSAARFANWLHNGATADASTETGAYTLDGATSGVIPRNSDATWWVPSGDEWYKAAFYDPTRSGESQYWRYPTRTDELTVAEAPPGRANSANYDGAMPEGQKITPTGAYPDSRSYYGTFDQAGLLWEWTDETYADFEGVPTTRGLRGGSWSLGIINISKFGPRDYEPTYNDDDTGFRMATTVKQGE